MTPEDIRTELLEILETDLGVYTKPNGDTLPAIWVKGSLPPKNWKVKGLQVIIFSDPDEVPTVGTSSVLQNRWFRVLLIQHDQNKDLYAPYSKIRDHFGVVRQRSRITDDTNDGDVNIYAEKVVLIYDPQVTKRPNI